MNSLLAVRNASGDNKLNCTLTRPLHASWTFAWRRTPVKHKRHMYMSSLYALSFQRVKLSLELGFAVALFLRGGKKVTTLLKTSHHVWDVHAHEIVLDVFQSLPPLNMITKIIARCRCWWARRRFESSGLLSWRRVASPKGAPLRNNFRYRACRTVTLAAMHVGVGGWPSDARHSVRPPSMNHY